MLRSSIVSLSVLSLALIACQKNKEEAKPLEIDRVPIVVERAFESAPPEINTAARDVAASVRQQDPKALVNLQQLTTKPGLTPEQQLAATRAMISVHKQLIDAAAKGDKRAEEALEQYRASK